MIRIFGNRETNRDQICQILHREREAISALADEPTAFVVSICGSVLEWGLTELPRTPENVPERALMQQMLGQINALADIY